MRQEKSTIAKPLTTNKHLIRWVEKMAELTQLHSGLNKPLTHHAAEAAMTDMLLYYAKTTSIGNTAGQTCGNFVCCER